MTTPKCLVCTCEDVTEAELHDAIDLGYEDIESLKRFTGLGTGPCQGKSCITLTRTILAETLDVDPNTLGGITYRPPVKPVPLRYLAGDDADADADADARSKTPRTDQGPPPGGEGP